MSKTASSIEAIQESQIGPDAKLVPDIAAFIQTYVVLPSDQHALVIALWVLHTWTWELADNTPYLYINSTEPQCGKTRLIETLELIVRNPLRAASATPSALIRAIEINQPTLLLDEIDTIWRPGARNELLRGIINDGYRRGGSFLRVQQMAPKSFATFCPKLLAGIFNAYMPETIIDRAIPVRLRRKDKHAECESFHSRTIKHSARLNDLLDRIETFIRSYSFFVEIQRPEPITEITDRQWEITEPLIALADTFNIDAREAILAMFQEQAQTPTIENRLIINIRNAFDENPKIFTADLISILGPPWTGKLLANWLKAFNIEPSQIRIGNQTGSGYKAEDFASAWSSV